MNSAVGLSLPATRRPPTSAKPAPLRSGAWTARPNRRDNQVTRRSTSAARAGASAPSTYAFKSASVRGSGFILRPRSLDDLQRRRLGRRCLSDTAELFARTRQSRHHGSNRDRQHSGNLFIAHFLNGGEHEHYTLIDRKPSDFTQDLHQFDTRLLHRAYRYLPRRIAVLVAID